MLSREEGKKLFLRLGDLVDLAGDTTIKAGTVSYRVYAQMVRSKSAEPVLPRKAAEAARLAAAAWDGIAEAWEEIEALEDASLEGTLT